MIEAAQETTDERQRRLLSARFLSEFASGKPDEVVTGWDEIGYLAEILPEVVALKGVPQRPDYHLEGDVWVHTLMVLGKLPSDASLTLKLAALLHDIGKPQSTVTREDFKRSIHSHDHQDVGAKVAARVLERFSEGMPYEVDKERIVWLVRFHLTGQGSGGQTLRESKIRRYFLRPDGWGQDLLVLITADTLGREAVDQKSKTATLDATIARIEGIKAKDARERTPPPPTPDGHRIMELFGLKPSPAVGQICDALREIHQQLGFTSRETGEEVASQLWKLLEVGEDTKKIPTKTLGKAVTKTIKAFDNRNLEQRLGYAAIRVFSTNEEDPIVGKDVRGSWRQYQIGRAAASDLIGRQVRILFLGTPRSGKTSFVYALANNFRSLVSQLPFELMVQEVDLDKSRADLSRLMKEVTSTSAWSGHKLRWTKALSLEAQRDFRLTPANILLGDGPGGEPDEITRTITRPANCAILIVSGDNDKIYQSRRQGYVNFLRERGIPLVAEFRSRPKGQIKDSGEKVQSELRVLHSRKFLAGQIVGLQFKEKNEDPVIYNTAEVLLFDILPALSQRRLRAINLWELIHKRF